MGIFNSYWEKEEFWAGEAHPIMQYVFNTGLAWSQIVNAYLGGSVDESVSSRFGRCQLDPESSPWCKSVAKSIDWVFGKDHCKNAIEYQLSRQKEIWHLSSTTDYPKPAPIYKHFNREDKPRTS